MRTIHADHVLLGDVLTPLRDGAVVVDEEGTVVAVGEAREVLGSPAFAMLPVERVHGVVFPGLVNAHTHLELSALRGRVPGGYGFVRWVDALVGLRTEVTQEEEAEGIARAVEELDAHGTAAVGEVTNSLGAVHALADRGIGGCIFHEVFGTQLEKLRARVAGLEEELRERVGGWPTPDLAYAPAPHTLYTLHLDVVRMIVDEVRARGRRTSLHVAEHAAERRALEHGDGPVVEWLAARTRTDPASFAWPHAGPIEVAAAVGALDPHVLLVHLTDARPDELARVAASGAPVVLCPRSNLYIEAKLPPLLAMREAGIEPALGTDSLASSPSLDVLAEARALADRFPRVPAAELVRMATHGGARALGREDLGAITQGARPGVVAVEGKVEGNPAAWLLRNVKAPRRWVARRVEP